MIKLSRDISLLRRASPSNGSFPSIDSGILIIFFSFFAKTLHVLFYLSTVERTDPVKKWEKWLVFIFSSPLLLLFIHFVKVENAKKVQKPFSLSVLLKDFTTYIFIITHSILLGCPLTAFSLTFAFSEGFVIFLDVLFLYNYYACDYLAEVYRKENIYNLMKLSKCHEKSYGVKKLTILESTNTCITMKNISTEDLDVSFEIGRQVLSFNSEYLSHRRCDSKWENKDNRREFRDFCHAEGCTIPPGKVFKLVTVEYDAGDLAYDEMCFIVPQYRMFCMDKDDFIVTTVFFKDSEHPFDVRLVQEYKQTTERLSETERRLKELMSNEEIQPPTIVHRYVPENDEPEEGAKEISNVNHDVLTISTTI